MEDIMNARNPKISFIIPVYNTERYLETCINSIINQEYYNYEIILVDDGSKDGSGEICDTFSREYANIKTIHQKNGGSSEARNTGIKNSVGEYLLFVDSDDFIEKNSLTKIAETLNSYHENIDVMFLEGMKFFSNKSIVSLGDGYDRGKIDGKTKRQVLQHIAELPKFPGSACTKLIRRQLIVENDLYFQSGLMAEDIDWVTGLLIKSDNFAYCDSTYYYYRQNREGSNTNSKDNRLFESLLYIIEKWSNIDYKTKEYQDIINSFMSYEYLMLLLTFERLDPKSKKKYRNRVRSLKWILKNKKGIKYKAIHQLLNVFGVSFISRLFKLYVKVR